MVKFTSKSEFLPRPPPPLFFFFFLRLFRPDLFDPSDLPANPFFHILPFLFFTCYPKIVSQPFGGKVSTFTGKCQSVATDRPSHKRDLGLNPHKDIFTTLKRTPFVFELVRPLIYDSFVNIESHRCSLTPHLRLISLLNKE